MIREVCSVVSGKTRVRTHPHLEDSPAECS